VDDGWQTRAVTDYRMHARNAAAMWEALSRGYGALLVGTERLRIVAPSPYHALRAIVLDPDTDRVDTIRHIVETLLPESGFSRRVIEDPSGELDLGPYGMELRFRLTVMGRPAEVPSGDTRCRGLRVVAVTDPERLAVAERIFIAVFPPPSPPDDPHGRIQPARVLDIPGWRVWLCYREGVPAGTAYTFHDGTSLGVYQVGTLPEHRGHGVARAIMTEILRAYPGVPVTLAATDQGRPLYHVMGFTTLREAIWWRPSRTGDDSGGVLR
jgi:GNAT superfamily N-acetyltransferase